MQPYKNEYKFTLLLIQTKNNEVFGAFIDDVFRKHLKGYIGSSETFVFTLKRSVKHPASMFSAQTMPISTLANGLGA